MHRVLVPTDFSEAALLVTREAVSWVTARGGELLLLHVVPDICLRWLDHLAITFTDQTRLAAAYQELREEGHRKFSTWLPHPDNERHRTLVVVGDTANAIVEVAQVEMVDLIIMRAPRRRWWRPILAGSVTYSVMRKACAPVVVWAGLERMSCGGLYQRARRPDAPHPAREGAWREPRAASMSWPAQVVKPDDDERHPMCDCIRSAKPRSIDRLDSPR
ncbi:MAG TPA: universal stress protein [Candidatus Tectomicrobia bacterium]|nr:universal stress protein [Candidatus Tectomicrobia bacterium]